MYKQAAKDIGAKIFGQKYGGCLNMENKKRILKGYSAEEHRELEDCKDSYGDAMSMCYFIHDDMVQAAEVSADKKCATALGEKYRKLRNCLDYSAINQLAKDITDYFTEHAKFPDKKYYVHFVKEVDDSYLNRGRNITFVGGKNIYTDMKTQFTREEALAIDPNIEAFLEEVPEEELEDD